MIDTICATKKGMSQIWDAAGKRIAVTKFLVEPNIVVGEVNAQIKTDKKSTSSAVQRIVEIGYGKKKLTRMSKPLRCRLEKLSLKEGVKKIVGMREVANQDALSLGQTVSWAEIFAVGSLVQVQGKTKGRGFAGGMKRHNFRGGPRTHGQSDRARAVGSVGNRTTPGRVWPGKRLPGHYGTQMVTVTGLTVVHTNAATGEIWLSGPTPGAYNAILTIKNLGKMNKKIKLSPPQTATANTSTPKKVEVSLKKEQKKTETKAAEKSTEKVVEQPKEKQS